MQITYLWQQIASARVVPTQDAFNMYDILTIGKFLTLVDRRDPAKLLPLIKQQFISITTPTTRSEMLGVHTTMSTPRGYTHGTEIQSLNFVVPDTRVSTYRVEAM